MKFAHTVFDIYEQRDRRTDGHTDTLISILHTPPAGDVISEVKGNYLRLWVELLSVIAYG